MHSAQESIDAWLAKPGSLPYSDIGKYAIANVLLKYERSKYLFRDIVSSHLPSTKPKVKPKQCWYRQLHKSIDGPLADFHKNKLSVITFNYDRSLEHFIYTTLKADNLDKNDATIAKAARSLEVLHVHGKLGYLPWQNTPKQDNNIVPYDTDGNHIEIRRASQHIKIIHEASELDDEFARARKLVMDAENIYIIGFGYDQTNLERLGVLGMYNSDRIKSVMGTALNISQRQKNNISKYLSWTRFQKFSTYDQTAFEFLYNTVLLE